MSRKVVMGAVLLLLLAAVAMVVGGMAYNLGVAQGLAQSGAAVSPVPGGPPLAFGRPFGLFRPWAYGFGYQGCFFPLMFFLAFVFLIRALFWSGHGCGGHRWRHGGPEAFAEWHRHAHAAPTAVPSAPVPPDLPAT